MVKYRILSNAELESLRKEFIQFLISNGITANDWELLKAEEPSKAERLVEMFSDIVIEKVLSKIEYLKKEEKSAIICFRFEKDFISMCALIAEPGSEIDLTDKSMISKAVINPPKGLKVVSQAKQYESTRPSEVYSLIQSGCEIDNGNLYHALSLSQKKAMN